MDKESLQRVQAKRFAVLKRLYEITNGDPDNLVNDEELAADLGMSFEEFSSITSYLDGEGLLGEGTMGCIAISHRGRVEVEEAINNPEHRTEHFPANVNVLIVQNAVNTQIQQGSDGSSQMATFAANFDIQKVTEFFQDVKNAIPELGLDYDRTAELNADVDAALAQLASPKPKHSAIKEFGKSVRNLLEGVAGNLIAAGLIHKFALLGQFFG